MSHHHSTGLRTILDPAWWGRNHRKIVAVTTVVIGICCSVPVVTKTLTALTKRIYKNEHLAEPVAWFVVLVEFFLLYLYVTSRPGYRRAYLWGMVFAVSISLGLCELEHFLQWNAGRAQWVFLERTLYVTYTVTAIPNVLQFITLHYAAKTFAEEDLAVLRETGAHREGGKHARAKRIFQRRHKTGEPVTHHLANEPVVQDRANELTTPQELSETRSEPSPIHRDRSQTVQQISIPDLANEQSDPGETAELTVIADGGRVTHISSRAERKEAAKEAIRNLLREGMTFEELTGPWLEKRFAEEPFNRGARSWQMLISEIKEEPEFRHLVQTA